ncbi:uncharacterized protein METZ01_LOCUS196335 [marine metagenome]|uniref:Uncharacterized protein n=1 Tax=marine metagenome TaxID=408172 RepID=A0A382E0J0_9ZZZZ
MDTTNKKLYFIENERIKQKPISYIKNDLAESLDCLLTNKSFGSYRDVIIAITLLAKSDNQFSDNEKKMIKDVTEYIFIIRGRGLFQVGNVPYTGKWDLAIYYCIMTDLIDSSFYNRDHLLKSVPNNFKKTSLDVSTQTSNKDEITEEIEI